VNLLYKNPQYCININTYQVSDYFFSKSINWRINL